VRTTLRRNLPAPVIESLRRARGNRVAAVAFESWALSKLPQAAKSPVVARTTLDASGILTHSDPDVWLRVRGCIEQACLHHNVGGVNPGDRRAICALAADTQPRTVLEIGTHIGSSTLTLAATLASVGTQITTVDIADVNDPVTRPWTRCGAPHSPAEIVRGLAPVTFVVDDSASYLSRCNAEYDFIFLDGDHSAAAVYRELPLALERLAPEGLVLLHDYFPDGRPLWTRGELICGPYLAVRRLLREGWPLRVLPLGELPWPTKLGSHATSLALVLAR
jgi:predicted O-methyltransferase YrrM